jgi:cell wall-associated NlpC family hydrolase
MTADEVNAYINLPWVGGARGPDSFDCWGLLSWVQREHFGVFLPERSTDAAAMRAIYHDELDAGRWRIIQRPFHGCGVLLRAGDRPHVGVYLRLDGGGVLHAMEGVGVTYTLRSQLRAMGYPRATWYEFLSGDSHPRP